MTLNGYISVCIWATAIMAYLTALLNEYLRSNHHLNKNFGVAFFMIATVIVRYVIHIMFPCISTRMKGQFYCPWNSSILYFGLILNWSSLLPMEVQLNLNLKYFFLVSLNIFLKVIHILYFGLILNWSSLLPMEVQLNLNLKYFF